MLGRVILGLELRRRLALGLRLDHLELEQVDAIRELDRQADAAFVRDVFGRRDRPTGSGGSLGFRLA